MHDARRLHRRPALRRIASAVLCSVALAVTAAATVPIYGNLAICAAYTPNDVEWYLFFCYLDPPPKDPKT